MNGDISKGLVTRVREYLGDPTREKLKWDLLIYDKLSFYQDYLMTTKLLSRLKITYPLITDQSVYPFLANVVQHTDLWWNEDIECVPEVFVTKTTAGDDTRQLTLSYSDTFRTGTDFMYAYAYTRPTKEEKITTAKDPIIEDVYHDLLIDYTVLYFQSEKRLELTMKQTEEIAQALRSTNRFEAMPLLTNKFIM